MLGHESGKGLQTELSVEKDDGVVLLEKVLGARTAPGPGTEVVDEPDVGLFEWDRRAAARDEHDSPSVRRLMSNKSFDGCTVKVRRCFVLHEKGRCLSLRL